MAGYYNDDDGSRAFQAFNNRRFADLEIGTTTVASKVLTAFFGLVVVFKALDFLGYPVWLWVHMALARVRISSFAARTPPSGTTSEEEPPATILQRGGQLFGRIFGLNSTSLLQRGMRGVTGFSGSSGAPPGLGNWDNSCFQNSVIQGLSALPTLREYLSKTTADNSSFNIDTTNGALFDILSKLGDPNHPGGHFWIRGKLKSMSTFQQQDAQEYYSKIMDALDKEVQAASKNKKRSSGSLLEATKNLGRTKKAKTAASADTAVKEEGKKEQESSENETFSPNPLDGLLAQRVGCIKCGYTEGLQLIPFNCLTVSLGNASMYDIRDCLTTYTELEHIEGVECAKCTLLRNRDALSKVATMNPAYKERLDEVEEALEDDDFNDKVLVKKFNIPKKNWATTTKSRQAVIARAPKALVMHVNRSIFNEWTGQLQKNDATVFYPQILDLGNWCLGKQPSKTNAPDDEVEDWPRDPARSMLGNIETAPIENSPFQYRLRAAVTHFGTHGSGHYVCFRPHPKRPSVQNETNEEEENKEAEEQKVDEQWWRFSDESVYPVAEEQAHQGNVFMLFYERIDESTTTPGTNAAAASPNATPIPEDLPLPPPSPVSSPTPFDETALNSPLPDSDSDTDSLLDVSASPPMTPPTLAAPHPTDDSPSPPLHRSMESDDLDDDQHAYPTPPPEHQPSAAAAPSEAESEDTQDTQSTLHAFEDELAPPSSSSSVVDPVQVKVSRSPQMMRTAGRSPARRRGGRRSLPMVSAL